MTRWIAALEKIPDALDSPFKFDPEDGGGRAERHEAFGLVIAQRVDGSIPFPGRPARYLIGFSNFCTHMGCRLTRDGERLSRDRKTNDLICGPCPCHGTNFNLSRRGIVVIGPASQHLPQLSLSMSNDNATLIGSFPPGNMVPTLENWPDGA